MSGMSYIRCLRGAASWLALAVLTLSLCSCVAQNTNPNRFRADQPPSRPRPTSPFAPNRAMAPMRPMPPRQRAAFAPQAVAPMRTAAPMQRTAFAPPTALPSPAVARTVVARPVVGPSGVAQVGHTEPLDGARNPVALAGCVDCGKTHAYSQHAPPALPSSAWTGPAHVGDDPWKPDGLYGPWPRDEYICDGGDQPGEVRVRSDWSVDGLNLEDTIAHFDTKDGRTIVAPSNRVCIYAPRFAAVRKVSSMVQARETMRSAGVSAPLRLGQQTDSVLVESAMQQNQAMGEIGLRAPIAYRERQESVLVHNNLAAIHFEQGFSPFEDLQFIRQGAFDNSQKARLADVTSAALAWTDKKGVQVVLDHTEAAIATTDVRPQVTFQYELGGKPRLRIGKIASRHQARPGDIIDFTLRFDNIGTQEIGNVTIIDNLTTRLEYVPDSAQCSLGAEFVASENEGESLTLRWEITEPLPIGAGGVIRFKCVVR